MGFQVTGQNGEELYYSGWTWRPLTTATRIACGTRIPLEDHRAILANDGARLTREQCEVMGLSLTSWLCRMPALAEFALEEMPHAYHVNREQMTDWAGFLCRCGGLEVW